MPSNCHSSLVSKYFVSSIMSAKQVFFVLVLLVAVVIIVSVTSLEVFGFHGRLKYQPLTRGPLSHMMIKESTLGQIYLAVLIYNGQQATGINSITSLQCWAGQTGLPIKIVEPAISTTQFTFSLRSDRLAFSDFFDIEHFNDVSRGAGYAEMMPRKDYLEVASRYVILISIPRNNHKEYRWSGSVKNPCYNGNSFPQFRKTHYCIVEIIVTSITSFMSHFYKLLSKWNLPGLSVVIREWLGPYHPIEECAHKLRSWKLQLHPSRRLLNDARHYIEKYIGNTTAYTAVMIRMEHIVHQVERQTYKHVKSIDGCLQGVKSTTQQVQGLTGVTPVITADIGKYGSKTFKSTPDVVKSTKDMMQELFHGRVSFEEWEESFVWAAGGVNHAGYIAALQRTIASQAKCLVLMGGGHFQDLALQEYIRLHGAKEQCVHIVCAQNRDLLRKRLLGLV